MFYQGCELYDDALLSGLSLPDVLGLEPVTPRKWSERFTTALPWRYLTINLEETVGKSLRLSKQYPTGLLFPE